MSKIKDILSIELENDIKNVIDLNSQNEEDIKDELDGFILTESLAKHLSDFLDVFCSDMNQECGLVAFMVPVNHISQR